ncbi:ABC transporter substrate-binding protein [Luedemannella flava]
MRTNKRRIAALGVVAALALGAAACGTGSTDGSSTEKITLVVDTFGKFGFEDLYKQYEAAHPNITISERATEGLDNYWPKLTQFLTAGGGAGDVVAIEEGIMPYYKSEAQAFVDLADYGAESLKSSFLPWKWEQGIAADGKVVGLGTDIGGLAMCYRTDLFAQAGLPTDRDEVSKLWPTWAEFVATGKKFKQAKPGTAFVDSPTQILNSSLMQAAGATNNLTYFDESGQLVIESNPAVKTAWELATEVIGAGLTSKLATWSPEWSAGFKNGAFATTACPSWMLGIIESNSGPENANKWDVARIPGDGGNWGGSFLAVPTQSEHPKEAAELAKFLTSPASHVAAFKAVGALPSDVKSLSDPAFLDLKNAYFNDAPVGKIFGEGAQRIKPVFVGLKNQAVRERAVEPAILDYANGKISADDAWKRAVSAAKAKAK